MRARPLSWLLAGIVLPLVSLPAIAQAAPDPSPAPATAAAPAALPPAAPATPGAAAPSPQAQDEARARFRRALELVEDGDFDAANLELQRAYELNPSYRILYNVGLVSQQLKQYARAYDAYEQYLREGGAEVPPDRVEEVHRRLERLKERVAYLRVTSDPPGASIYVDDASIGTTPLVTPVRVSSGQRRVSVKLPGRSTEARLVELAGGEQKEIRFDLTVNAAPVAPPKSPVPYIAWGTTGAIVAGAVVTGVLALTSTKSYDDTVNSPNSSSADINSAWSKAHGFALTTDILGAAAIVAAGVSVYFTIRPPKTGSSTNKTSASGSGLVILPGYLSGSF